MFRYVPRSGKNRQTVQAGFTRPGMSLRTGHPTAVPVANLSFWSASLSIWRSPPAKREWLVAIVPTNSPISTLLKI
jgi:hypothetical protein